MVLTPTTQIPLGYKAPEFNLLNPVINTFQSLHELQSKKATVIVFMCNHCPYVVHILDGLVQLANNYLLKDISFIGINSNDIISYPDDSPQNMIKLVEEYNIPFPYLFDETQEVAKLYSAACTPDFSVFNSDMDKNRLLLREADNVSDEIVKQSIFSDTNCQGCRDNAHIESHLEVKTCIESLFNESKTLAQNIAQDVALVAGMNAT